MNNTRIVATALGALTLGWLARSPAAKGEPVKAAVTTPTVEYTAQCFVDNATMHGYCQRRADVARLVDCTSADTRLQCRMQYMQLMGKSGWTLVRVGGGSYREWWDAPLFFYTRTITRTEGAPQ